MKYFYYLMSYNIKKVYKLSEVNAENIVHGQIVETNDGKYIVSKMWYKGNDMLSYTLNVQTPYLKLLKNNDCSENIMVSVPKTMAVHMDKIDRKTLQFIEDLDLIHKYNLKGIKYKTLISEVEDQDIFRIKIMSNNKRPTLFFSSDNKCEIKRDIVNHVLSHVDGVKIIFEIDGLIIDINNRIMFTNVIARHVLVSSIKPIRVEITEYSFIDSDEEKPNQENNVESDFVLNTQTEYNIDVKEIKTTQINNVKSINDVDEDISNTDYDEEQEELELEQNEHVKNSENDTSYSESSSSKLCFVNKLDEVKEVNETKSIDPNLASNKIIVNSTEANSKKKPKGKVTQKRAYVRKNKKAE